MFWAHPIVEEKLKAVLDLHEGTSPIEMLNTFFKEMVRLSVRNDEDQIKLREFRIYLAKKSVAFEGEISSDLKRDLFSFLEFDRFSADDYVKKRADEVLDYICGAIES